VEVAGTAAGDYSWWVVSAWGGVIAWSDGGTLLAVMDAWSGAARGRGLV